MEIMSFTDVEPAPNLAAHLPFPSLQAQSLEAASLLQNAADSEEMDRLLNSSDPALVERLSKLISEVDGNIRLKENVGGNGDNRNTLESTPLYQALVKSGDKLFKSLAKAKTRAQKAAARNASVSIFPNAEDMKSGDAQPPPSNTLQSPQIIIDDNEEDEAPLVLTGRAKSKPSVPKLSPPPPIKESVEDKDVEMAEVREEESVPLPLPAVVIIEEGISGFEDLVQAIMDSEYSFPETSSKANPSEPPPKNTNITLNSLQVLQRVAGEIIKLKELNQLHQVDADLLSSLLVALNVRIEKAMVTEFFIESVNDQLDSRKTKGKNPTVSLSINQQVLCGIEAAFIVLGTMSAPKMARKIFLNEILDSAVAFLHHLLHECIYPVFEKPKEVDGHENSEQTTSKEIAQLQKNLIKTMLGRIYTLLDLLEELVSIERLEDTLLLKISSIALSSFFLEDLGSLQLASLDLIRAIFQRNDHLRAVVFDDIFNSLAKLPTSKRHLRCFKIDGLDTSIQMVSALVMRLIHSFSGIPEAESLDLVVDNTDKKEQPEKVNNTISAAIQSANIFVHSFLTRCTNISTDGSSIDYRLLFENFVVDLVSVIAVPEFPSAEVFLQIIVSIMLRRLSDKNSDVSMRQYSMDIISIIASTILSENIQTQATFDNIIAEKKEVNGVDTYCYCQQPENGRFMIECGQCLKWFHGECVGIEGDKVPKKWECEMCVARKKAEEQVRTLTQTPTKPTTPTPTPKKGKTPPKKATPKRRRNAAQKPTQLEWEGDKEKTAKPSIDTLTANDSFFNLRSLLLDYFETKYHTDTSMKYIRQFHIAEWYGEEGISDGAKAYYQSIWGSSLSSSSFGDQSAVTSHNFKRMMMVTRQLAQKRTLATCFDTILNHILVTLHDSSGTIRAKALKSLSVFVATDPNILGHDSVKQAVQARFLDTSILVREVAMDLVGKYLFHRPEYVEQYYETISRHLLDTGISVRKRVVRILKSICIRQPNHMKVGDILVRLVGRINDESVRDLIVKTFEEIWFGPLPDGKNKEKAAAETVMKKAKVTGTHTVETKAAENFLQILVANTNAPTNEQEAVTEESEEKLALDVLVMDEIKNRTSQIVRIVASVSHNEWLVDLLTNSIAGEKVLHDELDDIANDEEKMDGNMPSLLNYKIHPARTLLSAMCSHLLHHILAIEEQNVAGSEDPNPNTNPENMVLPCLRTLEVFSSVMPETIASHVSLLVPYLASPNTASSNPKYAEHQAILSCVCNIIAACTPHLKWANQGLLEEMEKQLTVIVFKEGVSAVQSAVQCLSALISVVTHNTPLLSELLSRFYSLLCSLQPLFTGWPPTNINKLFNCRPTLYRSLFTAGLLCRHFDFDVMANDCEDGGVVRKVFESYKWYCVTAERILGLSVSKEEQHDIGSGTDTFVFEEKTTPTVPLTPELHKTVIEVHLRALQGLGHLYVREPHLMIEKEACSIFSTILSPSSPTPLKVQGLRNFAEFLAQEEDLMLTLDRERAATPLAGRNTAKRVSTPNSMENVGRDTPSRMQGDSGVSSGLMQTYLEPILTLSLDPESTVRLAAIKVIGLVLRQGLVLPVLCVPHVLALESDPEITVRDAAHMIMVFLSERYSGFVRNPPVLIQGIRLAYDFRKVCAVTSSSDPSHGFGKFYQKNICSDRFSRNQFLQQLVTKFECNDSTSEEDMAFLPFLAEVIANLPYSVHDEVLLIIHTVNRVLSLKGGSLLSQLKNTFGSVKTGSDGSVIAVYDSDEDDYTPITNSKSTLEEATTSNYLSHYCRSMILLLKLKAFLKGLYGLSNQKCQEFSPLVAPTIVRPCTKSEAPKFNADSALEMFVSSKVKKGKEAEPQSQLRREYEYFKQLMQDDANDVGEFAAVSLPHTRYSGGKRRKKVIHIEEENSEVKKGVRKSTRVVKRRKFADYGSEENDSDDDYVG